MGELPKNFPEYSIMYKILTKKIQNLQLKLKSVGNEQIKKIKEDIEMLESERQKIREKFPENFFDGIEPE